MGTQHSGEREAVYMMRTMLLPLVCALLVTLATRAAAAQTVMATRLVLLTSTQQAIQVELLAGDYTIDHVLQQGERFQRMQMPGTVPLQVAGSPQVPTLGTLLGLPTTAQVALQVLEADYTTLTGIRLQPAPGFVLDQSDLDHMGGSMRETFVLDEQRYATDAFYPGEPAELGEVGYLRDQVVAQVQFYPVQYNPVRRELRLYRQIRVQITWDTAEAEAIHADVRAVSPAYEALLRNSLLNYAALGRPPAGQAMSAASGATSNQDSPDLPVSALKIAVREAGLYQLTFDQLTSAGFDLSTIDPRTLSLSNRGAEVAIYVHGEADGRFDTTDYILFYGAAHRDRYTELNIYWLWASRGVGRRMAVRDGTPSSSRAAPLQLRNILHAEEDTAYWQTMPGQGEDRWFWGTRISPNSQDMPVSRPYTLTLRHAAREGEATVRVRLKGYTGLAHHTRIHLNDHLIDDQLWQGQIQFTHTVSVPQSYLQDGENVIAVEAANSGASIDQVLVNWIEIDYWDQYIAEDDQLVFGAPAEAVQLTRKGNRATSARAHRLYLPTLRTAIVGTIYEIGGFAEPNGTVLDITDPAMPVQITATWIAGDPGNHRVRFADRDSIDNKYLALTARQYKTPVSLARDIPSSWQSPANGADYIIITHEEFYEAVTTLADHHRAAGMRVATVRVGDIYDEFSDGLFNPEAIHTFLRHAYAHWVPPAPTYVLLVGDANQDYMDKLKTGTPNYVPSQNIDSSLFGEISSDNRFVAISGDDPLPDLLIGRLPAQSAQEADAMVRRLLSYDQQSPNQNWNANVLLVTDDDEPGFRTTSEEIAARFPLGYHLTRVDAQRYPPGDPTVDIIEAINRGSLLVNYVGHGEYSGWGRWNENARSIFDITDIAALDNADRLPVVVVGNCLNGFFAGPSENASLAEGFLRRDGAGAVAVWAPTGLGYTTGHGILLRAFYDALLMDEQKTLGAATTAAKINTYTYSRFWGELVDSYVLFGDPATAMPLPFATSGTPQGFLPVLF